MEQKIRAINQLMHLGFCFILATAISSVLIQGSIPFVSLTAVYLVLCSMIPFSCGRKQVLLASASAVAVATLLHIGISVFIVA